MTSVLQLVRLQLSIMGCGASASDKYQEPQQAGKKGIEAPAKVPSASSTTAAADSDTVSRQVPVASPCETPENAPIQTLESAAESSSEKPFAAAAAEEVPAAEGLEIPGKVEDAAHVDGAAMGAMVADEASENLDLPRAPEDAAHADADAMLSDAAVQQAEERAVELQAPAIPEPLASAAEEVVASEVPAMSVVDQATSPALESDAAAESTPALATELFEQLEGDANPVSITHSSARLELDRSAGDCLGIAVREADGALLITWTGEAGLIPGWSAENPDRAVQPGHRIIQVNGASGIAADLLSACRESVPVVLEVDRTHKAVKASVTSDGVANFCRGQIQQLFLIHDQEAMKHLDKRMDTYKGREMAFYRACCKKYGEEAKDPEFCANSTDDVLL